VVSLATVVILLERVLTRGATHRPRGRYGTGQ
jgi:hypothetical protein